MLTRILFWSAMTYQAALLLLLAYGRKLLTLFSLVLMLSLPQQSLACRVYPVYLPDGKVIMCQDCGDGNVICY